MTQDEDQQEEDEQDEDLQEEDQQDEHPQEEDQQESSSREQFLHAVGLEPARRKSRMSQGGGSRLSLPSLSTSRAVTELFPDMLDNYRTKEPQA